jgi:two-component system, NarL family, sensor histidine kinase UhpB
MRRGTPPPESPVARAQPFWLLKAARPRSLLWRLFVATALPLVVAGAVLIFGPVSVSYPITLTQAIGVIAALAVVLVVDLVLLRRTLAPLEQLTRLMHSVKPLAPGQRLRITGAGEEVAALAQAFNEMLDRLETERRESAREALMAQESERRRIARELHDEIGQVLTALVLQSEALARRVPSDLSGDLEELRETAREGAEDVRRIAHRLRPEALDELGLPSALVALSSAFGEQAGVEVERELQASLPALSPEAELVIYRVAQESLTNIARHAHASRAQLRLTNEDGGVALYVRDNGRGLPQRADESSSGIRGMRERAILIGARLTLDSAPDGGTEVRLHVPIGDPRQ